MFLRSELLTTTFTMVVTFIESIRNLIRTVMNCVVGTPPMRSIAIQYDNIKIAPKPEADNRVNFNNPHSTRIVPPPTIIGKSNMEVALGCNIDCDESTYFMYNPRTRDSNISKNCFTSVEANHKPHFFDLVTDTTGDSEENLFDFTTNMEVECRSKSKSSLKLSHFSFDEAPPTEEIAVIPVQEKPQKVPAPVAQGVVKVELRSILGGDYEPTRIPAERDPSTIQRSNTTPLALPKIPSHSSGRSIGSKRRTPRVQHKGSTRLVPSKDKSGQFSERRFMNHI